MKKSCWVVAGYGLFTMAGGLIGYLKAGSMASLIAGGLSGAVILVSAYAMSRKIKVAAFVALTVSLLLGVRFIGTWTETHKVMPDLIMIVLSAVSVIAILKYLKGRF